MVIRSVVIGLAISLMVCYAESAYSQSVRDGSCGENVRWSLKSGTLTISGEGEMYDYAYEGPYAPWYDDKESIKHVIIESGVTTVGNFSLMNCSNLESASIPSSVTKIKWAAFYICERLSSLVIPSSVTQIAENSFTGCNSLTSITIPGGVYEIENSAFFSCKNLKSVVIEDGVSVIGDAAFGLCDQLESVLIPSSVKIIGFGAFNYCTNLKTIVIPPGVKTIDGDAFGMCTALKSVTIPSTVTEIGDGAFAGCSSLDNVSFEGTDPPKCDMEPFERCNSLDSVCVPLDYASQYFCEIRAYPNPSVIDEYRELINDCSTVLSCGPLQQDIIVHQRANASLWESRSTECVKYQCLPENTHAFQTICYSSDGVDRMCVDGTCVESKEAVSEKEWRVEIEVNGLSVSTISLEEIVSTFVNVMGIDEQHITVGTETNDKGELVRVIVFVNDEKEAKSIGDRAKECSSYTRDNPNCTGFLSYVTHVEVKAQGLASESNYFEGMFMMFIVMMMVLVLV